ncbi:MAG: hypothetical protein AAF311_06465 [Pseudomonadota bacterium]
MAALARSACLVAALSTTACVSAASEATRDATPARLSAVPDATLRSLIRDHVRSIVGADYTADPLSLHETGRMQALDRGRTVLTGQERLIPDTEFWLEIVDVNGAQACRLVSKEGPDFLLSDVELCVPL